MTKLWKLLVFLLLAAFFSVAAGIPAPEAAETAEKPSYAHLPPVGGLMVRQIGSDGIHIEVKEGLNENDKVRGSEIIEQK